MLVAWGWTAETAGGRVLVPQHSAQAEQAAGRAPTLAGRAGLHNNLSPAGHSRTPGPPSYQKNKLAAACQLQE